MYKLYCDNCEARFPIPEKTLTRFIEDELYLIHCPKCKSTEVNILEVSGQRTGY